MQEILASPEPRDRSAARVHDGGSPDGRLVVVSNRLPMRRGADDPRELPSGGLVSALLPALAERPNSEWIGWDSGAAGGITAGRIRNVDLCGVPLPGRLVRRYYDGFCNQVLWPVLHCFQARVRYEAGDLEAYLDVQQRFADVLATRLRRDSRVWVHDYHLLALGKALRERGFAGRVGFFLHTPFPPSEIWNILPGSTELLRALGAYDVVGMHTTDYVENYALCCTRELGARSDGAWLSYGEGERAVRQRLVAVPVGIEPAEWEPDAEALQRSPSSTRLARMARGRRIVIGADRLDYSKGLVERCRAFESFLRQHPEWHQRVVYLQIASPSRAVVPEYQRERAELENVVSRINGELGRLDWTPIRYIYRSYSRDELARFYRQSDVGLVTPLRDGMNLVAKEFVAAQRADAPGVLVLSRFAGAAQGMPEALHVNPYMSGAVGDAIAQALDMEIEERRRRHGALLSRVRNESARAWADRFLALL